MMRRNHLNEVITNKIKWRRHIVRQRILSIVSCLIVFCMTYALILPALANRDASAVTTGTTETATVETPENVVSAIQTEPKEDWESIFADAKLTGVWREDLLSIAQSQLGYIESARNFIIAADGETTKGYTYYGDWYGDPYGDWDAMFVSFCLNFAGIENMPLDANPQAMVEVLDVTEEEVEEALAEGNKAPTDYYYTVKEYNPIAGDLVFFDTTGDGLADRVGIVTDVSLDGTQVNTVEGDSNNKVQSNTYEANDSTILGYGTLPAQPVTYTYTANGLTVKVSLPQGTTVPVDAVLSVTPIESGNEGYDALAEQASEAVDGKIATIKLYDISFYTADDNTYIPVDDDAKVTITFGEPVAASESTDVVVLHYDDKDENPVVLADTEIADQATKAAEVTFETEGFSTFAVIELTSMYQTVEGITGLENKSYIIAAVNNDSGENADGTPNTLPVMISDAVGDDLQKRLTTSFVYTDNKVTSVALTDYTNAVWTFEKAGTDTYYIKSSGEQYLSIPTTEQLALSDTPQEFRVVPATKLNANNGDVMNAVCIQAVNNSFYVDLAGNDALASVTGEYARPFTSYDETTDNHGHHLVLVEYTEPQPTVLTDLAGKNYIIVGVNLNGGNFDENGKPNPLPVLTGVTGTYTFDNGKGRTVNVLNGNGQETEGAAYVNDHVMAVALADTANAVWTFEKADGNGNAYWIKNTTANKYLNLNGENLTLSDKPQAIEALKAKGFEKGDDQNAIYLRTADATADGKYYYVNLLGNGNYPYFFGYNPGGNDDKGNHLALIEYKAQVTMPVISDDLVNNLAGKKLVITNVKEYAITGTPLNVDDDNEYNDRLKAAGVTVSAGQRTVTISSDSRADLVWEFESAGTPGQYYIKHVATGKYLHIYDEQGKTDDKPLTLTDADKKQAIRVLSANDGDAVWISSPKAGMYVDANGNGIFGGNGNDYNCIDLYGGDADNGFGVWNKSQGRLPDTNKFLLSEYSDLPMMDAVDPTVAANNLDGKTMVITAADYNTVMSNNATTIGNRNWLKAQEAAEKNGTVGVVAGTNLADVSWTFTSVPNGQANQYYITDSNGKYLNINGTSVALSADNKQPISVYLNNDGTFVLCATVDGKEYLLDFSRGDNAFSAWDRAHDKAEGNNKFKLTPVEQFDQESEVVTNLAGKTLALVGIHDGNSGTKRMALTSDIRTDNENHLTGVEVNLSGTTGKAYRFDDTKFTNNNELWTFEAVGDKLGVYYIKAANGKYLNIGDGFATVSNGKQEITVLSDTVVGGDGITYEVVYLRATVNGKDVYLRRELNGNDTGFYGKDTGDLNGFPEKRIVLVQPSTIYIDVEKGLNLETEDWLYKPQFADGSTFKEESVVDGGTLPVSGELNAEPVGNTRTIKTQHFVSFNFAESWDDYTAGKGRDFPQAYMASWAKVLDKNNNGYIDPAERGDINGDGYVIEEGEYNPDNREIDDAEKVAKIKAEFIQTLKDNVYDEDFQGESPYWGVEYELTHYEVILPDGSTLKDGSGNNAKFAPGTEYSVTANGMIAITDVDGTTHEVPYGSTFKAQYIEFSDILTFYINLYGVVADVAADIQPRYIEDFTLGLAIAHIYYPGKYAGDTTEDYNKSNEYINSLFKGAYGENVEPGIMHAVIDGFITRKDNGNYVDGEYIPEYRGNDNLFSDDPKNQRYLSAEMTPALGASATALAAHVLEYVRTVSDIDIMLKNYVSGNGEDKPTLNNKTIDTATFEVRWYVVKDQGDSWHIDGVTIGKTEPIPVTKTFYGLEEDAVKERVSYERTDTNISGEFDDIDTPNYQIGVSIAGDVDEYGNGTEYTLYYNMHPYDQDDLEKVFTYGDNKTCKDPNLNPEADQLYIYNGGENPYSWTMSAILKQQYKLEEQNYNFDGYDRVSKVTVKDKNGTSTDTFGTSAYVTGGTTASVEFNNYYTKKDTGMFIVKKISSVTGLPLAGAVFTLTGGPEGEEVDYTETTDADGEASFYNLEDGIYTLTETSAPDGFAIGATYTWTIEVKENGKVTYLGNTKLYDFNGGTDPIFKPLEIKNAPDTTTVKVIKQFVGISKDQVDSLAENYSIVMKPTEDGKETYTLKLKVGEDDEDDEDDEDNVITPVVSADGLTYTWTLTDVPEIGYTVTESQFKLPNYVTTVSVEGFKDGDYTTSVTDPVVANNKATFNATFDEKHEDGFTIYNSYANDFSMQITKVDDTGNNTLPGAIFDVYGDHNISTSTESVKVADQTLYYLGTIITDANGNATFNGWTDSDGVFHKLVLGYPYALVETKAPDGYNLLIEPIYLGVVTAEGVTDLDKEANPNLNLVFSNGVYSITVENTPGYKLPETGGPGTQLYTFGGLLLMAVPLMYGYKRKRVRKGGEMA